MISPESPVATGATRNDFSSRDLVNRVGPLSPALGRLNLDGLGASPPALGAVSLCAGLKMPLHRNARRTDAGHFTARQI